MSLIVEVKVVPSSGRQKCVLDKAGELKCYLKSPPEKGKANAELIKFFASLLRIPKSDINLQFGATFRKKRLKIDKDITFEEFLKILGITEKQLSI